MTKKLNLVPSLVLLILTIALTNGQDQLQPAPVPTTSAPGSTTASPQYIDCLKRCPSVNQYNPVCGTDNVSYNNRYKLGCAQQCGRTVEISHIGTCGPASGTAK